MLTMAAVLAMAAPIGERLKGQWGIVDVHDCVNGARYLAQIRQVDGNRLAIRGGSAGGYTTLCAVTSAILLRPGQATMESATWRRWQRTRISSNRAISNGLIGPYPLRSDFYAERSPIHFH